VFDHVRQAFGGLYLSALHDGNPRVRNWPAGQFGEM